MKSFILLVLLSFFNIVTLYSSDYKVIVTVNMDECSSCYNSIRFLKDLDSEFELEYVFLTEMQYDSSIIQEVLNFPEKGTFIWSDSLYKSYLFENNVSSVIFKSKHGNQQLTYSLKDDLDNYLVSYFNALLKEEEVFELPSNSFNPSSEELQLYNNDFYVLNTLQNNLIRIDRYYAIKDTVVRMDSTMMKEAYSSYFGVEDFDSAFSTSIKIIKDLELRNYFSLINYRITDDTIYVLSEYLDFQINFDKADTLGIGFNVLHKFDFNGKLLETIKLQNFDQALIDKTIKDINTNPESKNVFFAPDPIGFGINSNNDYLLSLYGFIGKKSKYPFYFVGIFEEDKKSNTLKFKKFFPYSLGKRFSKVGYSFSNIRFSWDGELFMNGLDDIVFHTNEPENYTDLSIFSKDEILENIQNVKNYIFYINKNKTYYYLYFLNDGQLSYARINIENMNSEIKNISFIKEEKISSKNALPDNIDLNYMIVPISNNKYKRIKIF